MKMHCTILLLSLSVVTINEVSATPTISKGETSNTHGFNFTEWRNSMNRIYQMNLSETHESDEMEGETVEAEDVAELYEWLGRLRDG
ncbi:unnamed protein product [Trichobilharzia szidati]|nr:unnamed protein product [Trichobilharzia szidati]